MKLNLDECLAHVKACLIAKRYYQVYGMDYQVTFSSVIKMMYDRILISLASTHHWSLHRLDVKNIFSMVFLMRRFIWSNHLILLLGGSLKR